MIPLAVIAGWSGDRWLTTARLAMDTPVPAIAEVEQFYDELPLGPWLLTAQGRVGSTTADGRKAATDIAVPDPAPAGDDTLGIECAAEKPSAVRIPGDPGLPRGPWVSGTATLPALGRPPWRTSGPGLPAYPYRESTTCTKYPETPGRWPTSTTAPSGRSAL
ncbi:hypothetical protein ACFUGD_07315 [Streptomyces sp. NPDC057217]|uniref:hypothetical protein n=1 Tax=Streptomyces sp. NPDC057217 TaxID=3346054 RepID=UPI0036356BAA